MPYKSNRQRTRDLLLEYDANIIPVHTRAAGLGNVYPWLNSNEAPKGWIGIPPIPDTAEFKMVYPWESIGLNILGDQIFMLASQSGYHGPREEFHKYFGSYIEHNKWEIMFDTFANFPLPGDRDKLYFDLDERILYYFDGDGYTPVNAMLIANTILEGGGA